MKKLVFTLALVLSTLLVLGQDNAQKQLAAAVYEEEVNGDLGKAINLYEIIVSDYADNRKVAAEALYRLGLSNEKLGNQKARTYYENLINNYGDQSDKVKLAKNRMNILLASSTPINEESVLMKNIYTGNLQWGQLSPSGKYYSYTDWDKDWNLWYTDISTGDTIQISKDASNSAPFAMVNFSIWSKGDDKVVYDFYSDTDLYSLRIWDRKTGNTSTLHESKSWTTPLEWSRDNKYILTAKFNAGFINVGLHNTETKEVRDFKLLKGNWRLISGPRRKFFATVSPDAKYVIFHYQAPDGTDLSLLSTKDGSIRSLEKHSANESWVKWEADGKGFLFISDRSGSPAIYRWAFENGNVVGEPELLYAGISDAFVAECTGNDGSLLLSSKNNESKIYTSSGDIRKSKLNKMELRIDQALEYRQPAFSNDGEKIAFIIRNEDSDKLRIMDKEFNILYDIPFSLRTEIVVAPVWTYDDTQIMVLDQDGAGNSINIVDAETKDIKRYTNVGGLGVMITDTEIIHGHYSDPKIAVYNINTSEQKVVHTGPEKSSSANFRISPDRRYVAYIQMHQELNINNQIMLMDLKDFSTKSVYPNKPGESAYLRDWLDDGKHLVIQIENLDSNNRVVSLQMHTLNIETGEIVPFGSLFKGQDISNWTFNRQGTMGITKRLKSQTSFWKLIY